MRYGQARIFESARQALAGGITAPSAGDDYLAMLDFVARTPAATLDDLLVQVQILRTLIRPENLAPEELEGALILCIEDGLRRLIDRQA